MAEMNENCGDELKIVNKKKEYAVSKKLICSSVPYFEKMFCCDLLESKENKVELDFDEHVFDSILDWVHSDSFIIKMDFVISFYDAADYLMINDRLFEPCLSYFHENFTIEHLPVVLCQVTKVSKLINSGSIENFICRHFLEITNTDVFLSYPFMTVEAILKMDLMVYSEYQVFEAIMKWVNRNIDYRKKYISKLLDCIRWCFMDLDNLSKVENNELIKTLPDFDAITSYNGNYGFNRSKQNLFVSIFKRDTSTLRIKVLDNEWFCLSIGDFTQDDSMSLEFVHGEYISDILFDSGAKGIRIDWIKKTFRWLDFKVAGETYYSQLIKVIVKFSHDDTDFYLEDEDAKLPDWVTTEEDLVLESNGEFIVIGKTKDEKKWFGMFPAGHESWFNGYVDHERSFKATVLDDVLYILTKDLQFIQFNIKTRSFDESEPFKDDFDFNELILTSHQKNDDKVILIDKSSGKGHIFYIKQKRWTQNYQIMNVNFSADGSKIPVNKLIIFTSAFLTMKNIKPLYKGLS